MGSEKNALNELYEAASFFSTLDQEKWKPIPLKYIDGVEDLFVVNLTNSLWENIITNLKQLEPEAIVAVPSLLETAKSIVADDKTTSFQSLLQSVKENIVLKPIKDIIKQILVAVKKIVQKLKIAYTSNNENDENTNNRNILELKQGIRDVIQRNPEYKKVREKIKEMTQAGGKRRKTRKKTSQKRKKKIRGGSLAPSPFVSAFIRKLCDDEVKRFSFD
jgi:hypothetical protein